MSAIQNNVDIWLIFICTPNGVIADIILSSQHPCADIFKMESHEPTTQSIIDWFGQTDDWLWKLSRIPKPDGDVFVGCAWREEDVPLHRAPMPFQNAIARHVLILEPTSLNPGLQENSHVVLNEKSSFVQRILPLRGGLTRPHFFTETSTSSETSTSWSEHENTYTYLESLLK